MESRSLRKLFQNTKQNSAVRPSEQGDLLVAMPEGPSHEAAEVPERRAVTLERKSEMSCTEGSRGLAVNKPEKKSTHKSLIEEMSVEREESGRRLQGIRLDVPHFLSTRISTS